MTASVAEVTVLSAAAANEEQVSASTAKDGELNKIHIKKMGSILQQQLKPIGNSVNT